MLVGSANPLYRRGQTIQRPVYDFSTHSRVPNAFEPVHPARYVIVEGILALHYDELLPLYDFSVYVDAPNGSDYVVATIDGQPAER